MNDVEERLKHLKLDLPAPAKPAGSYVPYVQTGDMVYISGQVSKNSDGSVIAGRVGSDLTLEQGKAAARACALSALSIIGASLGFPSVRRIVKVTGFVQAAPGFSAIPDVVNGASDLFVQVFGEAGKHARSSVGVAELPMHAAVELELVVQVVL